MQTKQQMKSKQTEEELMAAAVQVFGEKGYAAATIAEITERAGYAKGNFYRYWKSKDALFLDIMQARLHQHREERKARLDAAQDGESALEVLVDFLEAMIGDDEWPKIFLEFTVQGSGDPEVRDRLNTGIYRLSSDLFAEILSPYATDYEGLRKLGALVTALFEGYLIQRRIGSNVLSLRDLRRAILTLGRPLFNP
ncbi:TetR/AcrR family transcriptional regulator [Desulfobotulus sp.]|jgi:AcrR family transcriptional regulator|uniref:TetR/AcrR family transcriptional regulator n=1 Tax=Desulfobotulus sp. TaxID=1940337 RepID=UPI002A36FADE|nr:TetR/AcrR family transcriptional regulator [Desulfobotulus sp.]MDY0161726.1 TetR/AcrR family transcriptional regulator [Desulfobotulus sp.]